MFVPRMKKIGIFLLLGLYGMLLVTSCDASPKPATPTLPTPTATAIWIPPTPAVPGDALTWQDLQVSMVQSEITGSFFTEFGSQRIPSPGQKFLWVNVQLKNMGKSKMDIPAPEHFSVLYAATEYKPTYGHRQGYVDYTALGSTIFPGQEVDAWQRFDVPITADLPNLWFVFLPESSQIGVSSSSPKYPWGGEHPVYVWVCAP
jgi:hypothetical protein